MTKLNAPVHVLKGKGKYSEDKVETKGEREGEQEYERGVRKKKRKYIKGDVWIIHS